MQACSCAGEPINTFRLTLPLFLFSCPAQPEVQNAKEAIINKDEAIMIMLATFDDWLALVSIVCFRNQSVCRQ